MEVFEYQNDLRGIKSGDRLVEATKLSEVTEEFATGHIVEKHVKGVGIGKRGDEVRNERVAGHVSKDCALVTHMVDLLELDDFCLSEDFQRVYLWVILPVEGHGCVGRPNKADSRKGAWRLSARCRRERNAGREEEHANLCRVF